MGEMFSRRVWALLIGATALAVFAAGSMAMDQRRDPPASARGWLAELQRIPRVAARLPHRPDYRRSAFGAAWADATDVFGGNNACDTRNDILRRDLDEAVTAPGPRCAATVTAGRLRSPYSGRVLVFRRSRATAVQIDHIVRIGERCFGRLLEERFSEPGVEGHQREQKPEPVSYTHLTLPTIYSV